MWLQRLLNHSLMQIADFADNVIPNWATDEWSSFLTDVARTIHVNAKGHLTKHL